MSEKNSIQTDGESCAIQTATRLLRRLTQAVEEATESVISYDESHPDLWATCDEHPEGGCGYRSTPWFYDVLLMAIVDVGDARRFLEEVADGV